MTDVSESSPADASEDAGASSSSISSEGEPPDHEASDPEDELDASDVEALERELKQLRRDIHRLQAELDATPKPTWRQRHPVLTLFIITGLGAAAGYLVTKIRRDDHGKRARKHLQDLTSRAREVLNQIPDSLERTTDLARATVEAGTSEPDDVAEPKATGARWFAATNGERSLSGERASAPVEVLDRMTRSARRARQSVQDRARTATQEATERMVESVASDDDVLPASVKAKAAGLAATTVGGMLAKRLLRSAGRVAASMLLAFLGKKALDVLRGR